MIPPPSNGNVYDLLPPGIGNPESWGVKLAWEAWKTLASQGLEEWLSEMQLLTTGTPA